MKNQGKSWFWIKVFAEYMIAFSILAFILALPFRCTGFFSGYLGWGIVLPLILLEMDEETKDAIKKWALKKNNGAEVTDLE